ncbi:4'-phosphopantetheinyl transferase superfamily protein [Aliifodinibius salicampi]|uniref:4'-phosphopantetheinyl transferase superfamily protein n=1 Tax=Fodinibius salicampi TaxID=1920655 RepID=A0ABT3PWB1_9BACT|nr:4'-phosphopantetheinyl transferase superfamily protein [Fodinibius salicampi]MCW9712135.1 4'-phosphopantetheinyl transferase superfamily protein [Fodinibius salicampi]
MSNIFNRDQVPLPFEAIFGLDDIAEPSSKQLNRLHLEEQQELNQLENESRRREFVSSRLLFKKLAQEWELPEMEFLVWKNEWGNPFAKTRLEQFEVSIAHTNKKVLCGLAREHPIGIDLEPTDRKVADGLRTRIMHPEEKDGKDTVSTIQLWTIKEAYIKLLGKGLRLNMNDVKVLKDGDYFLAKLDNDKQAKVCSFQFDNNWLAIAFYS